MVHTHYLTPGTALLQHEYPNMACYCRYSRVCHLEAVQGVLYQVSSRQHPRSRAHVPSARFVNFVSGVNRKLIFAMLTQFFPGNQREIFDRHSWDFHDHIREKYGPVAKIHGSLGVRILSCPQPLLLTDSNCFGDRPEAYTSLTRRHYMRLQ